MNTHHPAMPLRQFLDERGVVMPSLVSVARLHKDFAVEPPLAMTKSATWNLPVSVGAFSMVHGPGHIQSVSIGRYCSIAPYAVIGANEHAIDWLSTSSLLEDPHLFGWNKLPALAALNTVKGYSFEDSVKPITIGNDVWIGHGAFVRGGVTIGDGAIIGSMANVIHDIPPYAIAVGNPARVLRLRFSEDIVKECLAFKWWRFSPDVALSTDPRNIRQSLDRMRDAEAKGQIVPYAPNAITRDKLHALGYS